MFKTFKKEFKNCNIRFDQKILIAVSGGVDSMVLWDLMEKSNYLYGVAHVNFSLRGEESDADEELVRRIAAERKTPFYAIKVDAVQFSKENGVSIQMAARILRYDFFKKLSEKQEYNTLATAHHLEDDIETFLLNLNRGTGIKGLAGIRSTTEKFRPLLGFTKSEIREYAAENSVEFREDKSNESTQYDRNWFRHEIIEPWKKRNPSLLKTMRQNLHHLKETYDILDEFVNQQSTVLQKELEKGYINFSTIDRLDRKQFYLYYVLAPLGFTSVQVNNLLVCIRKKQVGKVFLGKDSNIFVDRERVEIIRGIKDEEPFVYLIETNTSMISEPIRVELHRLLKEEYKPAIKNKKEEVVDRSKLMFPLKIRKWAAGDRMQPLGMTGKKKVSDILIDLKISRAQKEETYVLLSEDKVVWLIGHRLDDRYKVTEDSAKLLKIKHII
ncbi:MAG: tRNA(Ile)-lysidine synthase [Vicingaceae bacterium]|jgi:tRNA(Ile)-lysidine synthase